MVIMSSFWQGLVKPFFVLAPMADVTDAAFRQIIAKYGKPDLMFTEFVSADGLCHPVGRERLLIDLQYSESERPIVAQLFTAQPEKLEQAAKLCAELGFDGVDINMGCPDRTIEKQGAGAALMKNPQLARELIQAAKRGLMSRSHLDMPVSVKTRLGYNRDELETWLPELLAEEPAAVTIHARTRKEMSKVPARWERIKRAVEIRDNLKSQTLIIGNGDALDLADAKQKAETTGADGIMLGRAIFGNPWLFASGQASVVYSRSARGIRDQQNLTPTLPERLHVMLEHTKLFEELLGAHKSFAIMKKHYKAYVTDKALREQLMSCANAHEVETTVGSTGSRPRTQRCPFRT